jgi:4-cresol dehydrogenase (hydroxylating)
MRTTFLRSGLTPYRVDIDAMKDIVDARDPFWQKALMMKTIFDPDQIIACGRYNLA